MTTLFPRLRLRSLAGAFVMVLVLLMPSPALAWFGWLDEWTGPGPWWGELYQVKVACFGPPVPTTSELVGLASRALESTESFVAHLPGQIPPPDPQQPLIQDLKRIQGEWTELLTKLSEANRALNHVDTPVLVSPFSNNALPQAGSGTAEFRTAINGAIATLRIALESQINQLGRKQATLVGAGVLVTLCGPGQSKRFSIDVELDYWRTKHTDPRFAGGQPISMYTIMPSLTWNTFNGRKYDILEFGIGAGAYVFRSDGLDDFGGLIIQPKVDVHFPTSWSNEKLNHPKRILSMFTVRGSVMWVPQGFGQDAFAAPGEKTKNFGPEAKPSVSLFFNLNSLFTRTVSLPASP